jgi:biotin carboxyl carrier protein
MAKYKVTLDGKAYDVTVTDTATGAAVAVGGRTFEVALAAGTASPPVAAQTAISVTPTAAAARAGSPGDGNIVAPIPGVVTELCVAVGDTVTVGQVVLKLEAMKMENDIATPQAGAVAKILIKEGSEVRDGQLLMVIE